LPAVEVLESRLAPAFLLTAAQDLNNDSTDNVGRYNLPAPAPTQGWIHAATTPLIDPLGMAFASDHLHAYVATGTGATDGAIRVVTFPNATTLNVASNPFNTHTNGPLGEIFAMAVSPRDGQLYVADRDNNKIIRFDSSGVGTDLVTSATSPSLIRPSGLAFSADGSTLYVGNAGNNFNPGNAYIDQYDMTTLARSSFANGLSSSPVLSLAPDGRYLYVANGPAPGTSSDRIQYFDSTQSNPTANLFAQTGFAANVEALQWESPTSLFAAMYSAGVNTSTITHYAVKNNAVNGPVNSYHESPYMQGLTGMVLVDTPPTAANDATTGDENTPLTVQAPGVLANDSDVDGDALSAVLVQGPANGQLTLSASGGFTYTPAANYYGTDQFTYQASDGTNRSNVATVALTVRATTVTTLTDNGPNPSVTNQSVSFTVSVNGGSAISGENLQIEDADNSNAVVASPTLQNGTATFTLSNLSAALSGANHHLFAVYAGDSTHAASQSSQVNQPVYTPLAVAETVNGANVTIAGQSVSLAGPQRSMVDNIVVTFSRPVTLDAAALALRLHANVTVNGTSYAGGYGTVPETVSVSNPSGDGLTWVVSFGGAGVIGQSIADGIYDITLTGSAVHDTAVGQTYAQQAAVSGAAQNVTNTFYRLFGDTSGHQTVNTADSRALARAFDTSIGDAAYLAYLDYDGNGVINTADARAFGLRYNTAFSGFTPTM
jgi:hypothetical protein